MGRLSTKHAVLGLMIDRPSYGYNLQQQIAERLGFLGLAESTVYKNLAFLHWPMPQDELQAKLALSDPGDLPQLLAMAEEQARECLQELMALARPSLSELATADVEWELAARYMVDDFKARWLESLVDWLDGICEVMEERIKRTAGSTTAS